MASVDKFTDISMTNMLRHNSRQIENDSNTDIDRSRSELNYSFPLDHGGLTDYEYYKKIVGERYLYGRGTVREKDAITACGWVVTLPKEITGIPEKEEAFFKGVLDFVSERYGAENIVSNHCHYDEAGQPHIHIIFVPTTNLDHDQVHFKTKKTSTPIKTESGRYEYTYRYQLDSNGERIPVKNYARMSDYFDEKISCAEVINKAELQHFHGDLQKYLTENGIEGAVVNGATGGKNMTVKSMKEFTRATGLTVDEARTLQSEKEQLKDALVLSESKAATVTTTLSQKEATIDQLWEQLTQKDSTIEQLQKDLDSKDNLREKLEEKEHENQKLRSVANQMLHERDEKISSLSHSLEVKETELEKTASQNEMLQDRLQTMKAEYDKSQERIKELEAQLEKQKEVSHEPEKVEPERAWGHSEGWGQTSGWGRGEVTHTEEKTW